MSESAHRPDGPAVESMTPADWPDVQRIYREGIATGNATLDAEPPDWARWDAGHRRDCRLVARIGGEIVGWTALSPYSARPVYSGVAWESVYVAEVARGRGVGRTLLTRLIPETEAAGIWTLMAGIQLENEASRALHESAGFREIGVQLRVGRDANGRWRDVVLMERRSEVVGSD